MSMNQQQNISESNDSFENMGSSNTMNQHQDDEPN